MTGHAHFSALAEKNNALLEKLNFDPMQDDPFELDNPATFQESGLFTQQAIGSIFNDEAYVPPTVAERIAPAVGMLLVRPDMVHIAPRVEAFIAERFQLLDASIVTVDPETYWAMYGDAITGREARQSRLTRAAVYIGSPCRLFVFERMETKIDGIPAADYVFAHLKGKQGVAQEGTLRGDLVYNGAMESGLHTLADPQVARATDPFGAYRKIVKEGVNSPCRSLANPLLFFTGVGVHAPDHQEMQRDLMLLSPQIEGQEDVA